jgi:hypothetical protein
VGRTQNSDPTEQFKSFLENPGTIQRLVVSQEWPTIDNTNLFYLRSQSNAVLLALTGSANFSDVLPKRDDITSYTFINSRYEKQYWHKVPNSLYHWTDTGNPVEKTKTNDAWYSFTTSSANISTLIYAGAGMIPLGQLHWSGDTFVCTNKIGLRITGHIERDKLNRAGDLRLSYVGAFPTNSAVSGEWNFEYSYGGCDECPEFYPSYVHCKIGTLIVNQRLYALVVTNQLLPEEAYELKRHDFGDVNFEFWYTNSTQTLSNHIGPNVILKGMPEPRLEGLDQRRRPIIMATLVLISVIFIGLIARSSKKV